MMTGWELPPEGVPGRAYPWGGVGCATPEIAGRLDAEDAWRRGAPSDDGLMASMPDEWPYAGRYQVAFAERIAELRAAAHQDAPDGQGEH